MIQLRDVWYRYPNTQWALEGIDLSVDKEEYIYLCGANGSGKSTLGYLLNGLIPHFFGGTLKGSVLIDGINTLDRRVSDLMGKVGLVFQNADAQLFSNTVEEEIVFGLENLGLPPHEMDKRIKEISEMIHIEDLLERTPASLSGGEKRLVSLATVLAMEPEVLLLDEPLNGLDAKTQEAITQILTHLDLSYIIISHDIDFLATTTNAIYTMQAGRILLDNKLYAHEHVHVHPHGTYPHKHE